MPKARYYAFTATNQENQLITVSNNFHCLVNGEESESYYHKGIAEVLGVSAGDWQVIIDRIQSQQILCNEPILIILPNGQSQKVWVTAMAFFDPVIGYTGANFALTADIMVQEDMQLPSSKELSDMLRYLISLAGSRPQDEIQAIKAYFLEVIRLLSSILYQFGGTKFRGALFDELHRTVKQNALPIEISSQTIHIPEVQEGNDLASYLIPLIQSARNFVADLVGEQIVNDEIEELERQLTPTSRRDLGKYHLTSLNVRAQ